MGISTRSRQLPFKCKAARRFGECPHAGARLNAMWKVLLLVYVELDVRLRIGGLRKRRFHHYLSSDAMDDAIESFRGFPDLVRELTSGAATIEYEIKTIERPLTSLTPRSENEFWPSPDDTRTELDQCAPAGRRDSVFVLWPQHNFECKTSYRALPGAWPSEPVIG